MAAAGSHTLAHIEENIPDLTCTPLVEIASQLERAQSPELTLPVAQGDGVQYYQSYEEDDDLAFPGVSVAKSLPPPIFDLPAVQVIYFDIYGTLIDKEQGVFEALEPLLRQSSYQFDRTAAISFYLESESEIKKQTPGAPYAQVLSDAYDDVALRLGMESTKADSWRFTRSFFHWPLIPLAEHCLATLRTIPDLSIAAIADADHYSLQRSSAFMALAPYFDAVFTWDACAAYKPEFAAFERPLSYYDALGVRRERSCLVSASMFTDLEPARRLGVPAVWMRYQRSLAENVQPWEGAYPALVLRDLADLAATFVTTNVRCLPLPSVQPLHRCTKSKS
ncbi:HAD-like domain-containing protein [Mycena galopus ATCC 62051]|nr:HAD-like domain-containing protein [Mycena galopus ATCC 62051]